MIGAFASSTTRLSVFEIRKGVTISGASNVSMRIPFIADALNHATALCTALITAADGLLMFINNKTIFGLSPLQIDGGSNFLAHAGCKYNSSYC